MGAFFTNVQNVVLRGVKKTAVLIRILNLKNVRSVAIMLAQRLDPFKIEGVHHKE